MVTVTDQPVFCEICGKSYPMDSPDVDHDRRYGVWSCRDEAPCLMRRAVASGSFCGAVSADGDSCERVPHPDGERHAAVREW